ncbi:hypothetical protein QTI73_11185 [Clostridium perfringens]|nr:hypothetical protein [Clostridium perfringens]
MNTNFAYMKKNDKSPLFNIIAWIIPLSCILLQYKANFLTYGLLVLIAITICIIFKERSFYIDKEFVIIGLLISIQQIISALFLNFDIISNINIVITVWLIIISCSISLMIKNNDLLYKNYSLLGIITTCAIYIQFFMYNLLGKKISSIMLISQAEEYSRNWVVDGTRPSGFFSEPQTHCSFMLPLIIIALEKKNYKFAIFLSLGLILTGSSLGVIMISLVWVSVLLSSSVCTNKKIVMMFLILISVFTFFTLDSLEPAREKIFTVFNDFSTYLDAKMTNNHSYTNYLRLIKGWVTYIEMPISTKIMGVGITNFPIYLQNCGITFSWSTIWDINATMVAYFSSAAGVFIECGLFVGIVYYIFLFKKFKQGNSIGKKLIILLFFQSFLTQTFFNNIFIFYFLMYYAYNKNIKSIVKIRI